MQWTRVASLALVLAGATTALAGPEQPDDALKRVVKNQKKLDSYRVEVTVQGGIARGADHTLTQIRVNENYTSDVVRGVARVTAPEAMRARFGKQGTGGIKDAARWKAILATDSGRLLDRLFLRPEEHLARAYRYKKRAEWLAAGQGGAPGAAPGGSGLTVDDSALFGDAEDEAEGKPGKTTRSRDDEGAGSKSDAEASEPTPHRMRVIGPPQEAIEQFTTIVNSGCFTEG